MNLRPVVLEAAVLQPLPTLYGYLVLYKWEIPGLFFFIFVFSLQ